MLLWQYSRMQRILVIDDEESIRDLLTDFLEGKGFEVVSTQDGKSGLALLKEDKFDLFLLDLNDARHERS